MRELDYKESWAPKNWCFWTVVLENTLENPLDHKEIQPVHPKRDQSWKDLCWSWNSNTLATWCKELTHWKRAWCWERLRAGEGDDRGWDGWMASLTQWTRVWVNSWSWWWTGRCDVLQFMESQRVRRDWVTELNWRHSINDLAPRTVSSLMETVAAQLWVCVLHLFTQASILYPSGEGKLYAFQFAFCSFALYVTMSS